MRFTHFSFLTFCLLHTQSSFARDFIEGGADADPRSAIAQTAISLGDLSQSGDLTRAFCSGVIISDHSIVTAAHCLAGRDPTQTVVLFGFNGNVTSVMRTGSEIHIPDHYHPYGDALPNAKNNLDIGVLVFTGSLPSGFKPALLESNELKPSDAGSSFTIAGFGGPKPGVLDLCDVTLKDNAFSESEFELNSSHACTPAGGDSGGPDFRISRNRVVLYGIHNWGWEDEAGNPTMSVEAKISFYAKWILGF
jgi:secreted trypsin-like serine protease